MHAIFVIVHSGPRMDDVFFRDKLYSEIQRDHRDPDSPNSCVLLSVEGAVATITLNRPKELNAIDGCMPLNLQRCVEKANDDPRVHVIVVRGAGKGFCGGYDLSRFAATPGAQKFTAGSQPPPYDVVLDYKFMAQCTAAYTSLFHSLKPTVALVHGSGAVAGGSDIALCCDFLMMEDRARIGYPPARVWGVPTTSFWQHRVGLQNAKRMLLTGDLIDGARAVRMGLALASYPDKASLEEAVASLCARMCAVPRSQLAMNKMVVNSAVDSSPLAVGQRLATIFDGAARHDPAGAAFKRLAEERGWREAVRRRDEGAHLTAKL